MKDDLKSFYVAVILSAFVVFGVNYFFPKQVVQTPVEEEVSVPVENTEQIVDNKETLSSFEDASEVKLKDERISIKNNVLTGSIRLKGARFDDLLLSKYKNTIDADSKPVELLSPAKTANSYYAEYGWLSSNKNLKLPNKETIWTVLGDRELTPTSPVTLLWDNGEGVKFIYNISLDDNYLFEIKQTIENNTNETITLIPYGILSRRISDIAKRGGIVHEGFTAILDNDLKEINYADMKKLDEPKNFDTTGGWISFSDKYWFSAFVFNDVYKSKVSLRKIGDDFFQTDFKGLSLQIQPGSASSIDSKFFAGAKEIKLLDKYSENIKKFDLAVDFGWYYFLTKPFFYILDFLYNFIGNMGWAILLFAALLRIFLFPIANKSYENMSKMKKIQPKLVILQELYKEDKMGLQRATMDLYKKEKINPASGCLPMFIQIPIFFSLYKVLNIAIEIRHAPFIGWIKDLSAPDPLTISVWSNVYIPSMLDIGIWPIIYGLTMYIQQKLNPAPANRDQARMFALMPIVFTIMFAHFAVGLVIYWTLSNVLSIIQQKLIMHRNGVK